MLLKKEPRIRGSSWIVLALSLLIVPGIPGCAEDQGPATYDEDAAITWTPTGTRGDNVSASKSFEFNGSEGGSFSYHHLTLDFPPGAVKGRTTLTITAIDPSRLVWDLQITKNGFKVPVTATVTYNGMSEAKTHTMLWFDESAKKWVDIGGQDYPDRGMFQVELDHFSIYGLADGTSGWD